MSFKDMVAADNHTTFLNLDEYGEKRIVIYDGVTYDGDDHEGIPVVLSGLKEKDRRQLMSDHIQGLYLVSAVMHCAISDLGGKQPEKGTRIKIRAAAFSARSMLQRPSATSECCASNWRRWMNEYNSR